MSINATAAYWSFRNSLSRRLKSPPVRNALMVLNEDHATLCGQTFISCDIIVNGDDPLIESCAFINSTLTINGRFSVVRNCEFRTNTGEFQCN